MIVKEDSKSEPEVSFEPVVTVNDSETGILYGSRSGGFIVTDDNICMGWGKVALSDKGASVGIVKVALPLPVKSGTVAQVVLGARSKLIATQQLIAKVEGNSIVFADSLLNGTATTNLTDVEISDDSSFEFTFRYFI